MSEAVCAITVLYRPDTSLLRTQCEALAPQVRWRVWIDNGPDDTALRMLAQQCGASYLPLGSNLGIAAAQNRGLAWARQHGASHALLLDQDSVPGATLVAGLRKALGGEVLAAAGPAWAQAEGVPRGHDPVEECGFLIASGMLAPLAVFDRAGLLREDLFIDHVDTEWCWRARRAGVHLLLVRSAPMRHRLGDGGTRFWLLRWRRLAHYPPWRSYMQTRNALALLRDPAAAPLPLPGRLYLVWRSVAIAMLALLLQDQRGPRLRWLRRAVADGWALRLGAPPADPRHSN